MVTWENYEEYLMMQADGELSPAEAQELQAFVTLHPELRKEMAAYELTKFAPDTAQLYGDKQSLLKPVGDVRMFVIPNWVKYGIAAGLLLLVAVGLFRASLEKERKVQIVGVGKQDRPNRETVAAKEHQVDTNRAAAHAANPVVISATDRAGAHPKVFARVAKKSGRIMSVRNDATLEVASNNDGRAQQQQMSALTIAGPSRLPVDVPELYTPALALSDAPVPNNPVQRSSAMRVLWDKVPIAKRNKKQLENAAGFVARTFRDVTSTNNDADDKGISLRIKNNQLLISVN